VSHKNVTLFILVASTIFNMKSPHKSLTVRSDRLNIKR